MGVHHQCCIKRILKLNWYKAKVCNKLLVGLSAIFLGAFGIHKFILGYHLEGLILFGTTLVLSFFYLTVITFLVGLIEGIMYLLKSNQEFQKTYVQNKRAWF